MSVKQAFRQQVMVAIRDWIEAEHLTQKQAGERLGLYRQQVCEIMRFRSRYSLARLLEAWEASGGRFELHLVRGEPREQRQ